VLNTVAKSIPPLQNNHRNSFFRRYLDSRSKIALPKPHLQPKSSEKRFFEMKHERIDQRLRAASTLSPLTRCNKQKLRCWRAVETCHWPALTAKKNEFNKKSRLVWKERFPFNCLCLQWDSSWTVNIYTPLHLVPFGPFRMKSPEHLPYALTPLKWTEWAPWALQTYSIEMNGSNA